MFSHQCVSLIQLIKRKKMYKPLTFKVLTWMLNSKNWLTQRLGVRTKVVPMSVKKFSKLRVLPNARNKT